MRKQAIEATPQNGMTLSLYSEHSNLWMYADEASLYSIEEDSREQQEETEDRTAAFAAATPANNNNIENGNTAEEEEENGGVEICFKEEDLVSKASDDQFMLFYNSKTRARRRRRLALVCLLLVGCTALLGTAIALSVSWSLQNRSSRGAVAEISKSTNDDDKDKNSQTTAPESSSSQTPSAPPPSTAAPTAQQDNVRYVLAENLVYSAVQECPFGAGTFFDESTIPGRAFARLIQEVYQNNNNIVDNAEIQSVGNVPNTESAPTAAPIVANAAETVTNLLYSNDYLREKYVLLVLYYSTHGDEWLDHDNWLSYSDPCNETDQSRSDGKNWTGVQCSKRTEERSCAIVQLLLGTYGDVFFQKEKFSDWQGYLLTFHFFTFIHSFFP